MYSLILWWSKSRIYFFQTTQDQRWWVLPCLLALWGTGVYVNPLPAQTVAGEATMNLSLVVGSLDTDDDGMANEWELQIVQADLNDGINSILDVLPDDDFDGDGASNLEEYYAGSDPLDPNSSFHVMEMELLSGNRVDITWSSSTNTLPQPREYALIGADSVEALSTTNGGQLGSNVFAAAGNETSLEVEDPSSPTGTTARFYSIQLVQPPLR